MRRTLIKLSLVTALVWIVGLLLVMLAYLLNAIVMVG
jgi:hypothetical protein